MLFNASAALLIPLPYTAYHSAVGEGVSESCARAASPADKARKMMVRMRQMIEAIRFHELNNGQVEAIALMEAGLVRGGNYV